VPYSDQRGRLADAFGCAVLDAVRPPTVVAVALGSALITATLLIPRIGPLVALGLLPVAAWGYVSQFCFGTAGALDERARLVLAPEAVPVAQVPTMTRRERVVRAGLGVLAAAALVAPLVIRNQGYILPPAAATSQVLAGAGLALVGWLLIPLLFLVVLAHDPNGCLPPRLTLAALARHPAATLAALLVVPLGLMMIEGLLALITWQQGQLPLMILDGFPPPTFERTEDGRHALFNYDRQVFDLKSTAPEVEVIRLYPRGLRRGFTLLGTIPLTLSVGLFELREEPARFNVLPGHYLATRIALTFIILSGTGLLLTVQARWLGLIAALDPHRPVTVPVATSS
jgi:hypothetical protein